MNRIGVAIAAGALFSVSAAAQSQTGAQSSSQASVQAGQTQAQTSGHVSASTSASAQNGQANGSLATGTAFNAALSSPIDSKKCKPGDPVNAHNTEAVKSEGKTVIPKGSKLVGHVTQASARGKGESESSLGIVFDKAILKNGGQRGRSCWRNRKLRGKRRREHRRYLEGGSRRLEHRGPTHFKQPRRLWPERSEPERGWLECHRGFGDHFRREERASGKRHADAPGFAGSGRRTGRVQAACGEQAGTKIRAEVRT